MSVCIQVFSNVVKEVHQWQTSMSVCIHICRMGDMHSCICVYVYKYACLDVDK